jgi:hypothetical protein
MGIKNEKRRFVRKLLITGMITGVNTQITGQKHWSVYPGCQLAKISLNSWVELKVLVRCKLWVMILCSCKKTTSLADWSHKALNAKDSNLHIFDICFSWDLCVECLTRKICDTNEHHLTHVSSWPSLGFLWTRRKWEFLNILPAGEDLSISGNSHVTQQGPEGHIACQ